MSGDATRETAPPIVVAGAGGFVGRHLVARLLELAQPVVVASSTPGGMIDAASGSLRADAAWPSRVGAVVFLAQSPHYRCADGHFVHLLRVNQCLAMEMAERAIDAGATRFVYASTGSVYSPSFLPLSEASALRRGDAYALSKIHAEEALTLVGARMETIALRLFGVYGPGQSGKLIPNLVDRLRRSEPVSLERNPHDASDRDGLRLSLAYVDDVVEVVRQVLTQGGPPVLNVAHRTPTSIRELAESIAARIAVPVRFVGSGKDRNGDLVADSSMLDGEGLGCKTDLATGLDRALSTP